MTTNNHPAHGPVSLERLHQISEILSKAAAQSDGGNLGYAMADAVKVIDGVIADFGAEPVITVGDDGADALAYRRLIQTFPPGTKLYTAPPLQVVPEALLFAMEEVLRISDRDHEAWHKVRNGIAHFRAVMIHAGNSPVTPDGYVLVPIEPTENMIIAGFEAELREEFRDPEAWERFEAMSGCQQAAHRAKLCWAAMIKAAPQQE